MNILFLILISVTSGAIGAWFISRYAYKLGLIDTPNDRSSHTMPTPRGGGVGILLAFVIAAFIATPPVFYWLPAVVISLVSFFDDKLNLTPKTRLVFQFASAFVALIPLFDPTSSILFQSTILLVCLSVVIVGTANFYNFMDGINGIAGLTGAVGFTLLAVFSLENGHNSQALMMFSLSLSCIGFLPFNIPSAKVFMGDVGSILLGFVFALSVSYLSNSIMQFLALSGGLFPFYADTLSTLFVRWRDGEKLSQAHRRHLYQIMANQMNILHWKVSLGYAVLQGIIGVVCLKLLVIGWIWVTLFLGSAFTFWCMVMFWIRRVYEPKNTI